MRTFRTHDNVGHHLRGNRSEQNSVAKVAGCDVIARRASCAQNRESVRSSGAKARPFLENSGVAQFRHEVDRGLDADAEGYRRRSACRNRLPPPLPRPAGARRCEESDTPSANESHACKRFREGIARQSIWPFTGRVGNG